LSLKVKALSVVCVLVVMFVLWWSHFRFFEPAFHFEGTNYKNLVSGNSKLMLVSSPTNEKAKIKAPDSLPFWKIIGYVKGRDSGTLWGFTYKGEKYVDYKPNTEMPWDDVYKYTHQ
jgi:hypothetical protein